MSQISLVREKEVFVLNLGSDENRITPEFLTATHDALDEVEASEGAAALITTAEGKFFSNGFDLQTVLELGREAIGFLADTQALWARLLTFPMPTIAAINGHAFGAGAVHVLAHDFRIMRQERGYICLPEIDLKVQFRPGMMALVKSALTPNIWRDATLTGARYAAAAAVIAGIADEAVPEENLRARALERAAALASKDRKTYGAMKRQMYADVVEQLMADSKRG